MPLCSHPSCSYLLSLLVLRINDGISHIRKLFWLDSSRETMATVTSPNSFNTGYYNRNLFISNLSLPVKKQGHLWGSFYRRDIICCVQVLNVCFWGIGGGGRGGTVNSNHKQSGLRMTSNWYWPWNMYLSVSLYTDMCLSVTQAGSTHSLAPSSGEMIRGNSPQWGNVWQWLQTRVMHFSAAVF